MTKILILLQAVKVAASPGLEGDDGIEARFATSHAHDFEQRSFVKVVVELVFINKEQIRNQGEFKAIIAKRQVRQATRHITCPPPNPVIIEKSPIRRLTK